MWVLCIFITRADWLEVISVSPCGCTEVVTDVTSGLIPPWSYHQESESITYTDWNHSRGSEDKRARQRWSTGFSFIWRSAETSTWRQTCHVWKDHAKALCTHVWPAVKWLRKHICWQTVGRRSRCSRRNNILLGVLVRNWRWYFSYNFRLHPLVGLCLCRFPVLSKPGAGEQPSPHHLYCLFLVLF